ncbi:MAG: site-2 protease family protein [Chloroflexi bacterium]|nr:site-2 protease family protein [Chloroflexota bacterium]
MNVDFLAGLVFVAVFAGVILIHEIGHFVVGRLFKVEIEEFGVGLPPRILTLFRWQGTDFTLNWLPLGGFNRFKGENDPNVPGGLAAASPWVRMAVLLAGATMNLLAGVLVFSILYTQTGVPDFNTVQVYEVSPGSPADQAGLLTNDIILAVGGEPVNDDGQLRAIIHDYLDRPLPMTVQRGDQVVELTAVPLSSRTVEEGALGFVPGPGYIAPASWFATLPYSVRMTVAQGQQILLLPAQLIRGTLSPEEGRFLGFKGIYDIFQQTVDRDVESRTMPSAAAAPAGPTYFTLRLIAMLTITLGVFNLLPFPALDGGRILFVLYEIILRRRVPPEFENVVHAVGMMILLAFMLYVNVMDFINPVNIILP